MLMLSLLCRQVPVTQLPLQRCNISVKWINSCPTLDVAATYANKICWQKIQLATALYSYTFFFFLLCTKPPVCDAEKAPHCTCVWPQITNHKRDGLCLGLQDQNVKTLAMSQFQDKASVVCRSSVVDCNQALLNETVRPTEDAWLRH